MFRSRELCWKSGDAVIKRRSVLADPRPLVDVEVESGHVTRSTIVSGQEWLAVSIKGFSEQPPCRSLAHVVKELVQNALDSVGKTGRIDLELKPPGALRAFVSFQLLLHELAHHEAFHHGRSYLREVEAYAGVAAAVWSSLPMNSSSWLRERRWGLAGR